MNEKILLKAIPSTEEASFRDLCNALGDDKPEKGDRAEWGLFFDTLRKLERQGEVEVSWSPDGRSVDSVILTEAGAARVRSGL